LDETIARRAAIRIAVSLLDSLRPWMAMVLVPAVLLTTGSINALARERERDDALTNNFD
jgi:hypothetical protein